MSEKYSDAESMPKVEDLNFEGTDDYLDMKSKPVEDKVFVPGPLVYVDDAKDKRIEELEAKLKRDIRQYKICIDDLRGIIRTEQQAHEATKKSLEIYKGLHENNNSFQLKTLAEAAQLREALVHLDNEVAKSSKLKCFSCGELIYEKHHHLSSCLVHKALYEKEIG